MLADFLKRFFKPSESGLPPENTSDPEPNEFQVQMNEIADLAEAQKGMLDAYRKLGQRNAGVLAAQQTLFNQLSEKIKTSDPGAVAMAFLLVLDTTLREGTRASRPSTSNSSPFNPASQYAKNTN